MKIVFLEKTRSAKAEILTSEIELRGHSVMTLCGVDKSEIKKLIKEEKPDIVHALGEKSCLRYASASGARTVFTKCGKKPSFFMPKYDAEYEFPKLVCSPVGVNAEKRNGLRSELGIKDEFTFLALGDAEPVSDLKTFVLAAAEAVGTHNELKFLLSSEGSVSESLKALCTDLGITGNVIFLPSEISFSDAVAASDAVVSSASGEIDLLCAAKALGMGIPLLLSEKCETGFGEINGKAGLTFDDENSEMLATAMLTFLENNSLRDRMKENAERLFREKYSAEKAADELEGLYLSLIK